MNLIKSGRKPVTAINQLFLYLVWLQNGFTLQHLSWLFIISIPTASRFISWTNVLYFKLRNVTTWPIQEQADEYMPESFKQTYPSTRSIIACIELHCQRLSWSSTKAHCIWIIRVTWPTKFWLVFLRWICHHHPIVISNELKELGVVLKIPCFLAGRGRSVNWS